MRWIWSKFQVNGYYCNVINCAWFFGGQYLLIYSILYKQIVLESFTFVVQSMIHSTIFFIALCNLLSNTGEKNLRVDHVRVSKPTTNLRFHSYLYSSPWHFPLSERISELFSPGVLWQKVFIWCHDEIEQVYEIQFFHKYSSAVNLSSLLSDTL